MVKIDNVEVLFPFEKPYQCQVSMMESVVQCIREGKHGLIESPTGTGKTLSILCAAVAAVQKSRTEYIIRQANRKASSGDTTAGEDEESKGGEGGEAAMTIIYCTRTHS